MEMTANRQECLDEANGEIGKDVRFHLEMLDRVYPGESVRFADNMIATLQAHKAARTLTESR